MSLTTCIFTLHQVIYGFCYGHYYPSVNGYFVSLVTEDRATELWGWNLFAGVVLSWVPPLIFTSVNETSGNLRLAMLGLFSFLVVGFLIALTIPPNTNEHAAGAADDAKFANEGAEEGEKKDVEAAVGDIDSATKTEEVDAPEEPAGK